ncbi:MAG: hypothetical protein ACKO2K_14080, partial [Alphaproteobacteria bacterium]
MLAFAFATTPRGASRASLDPIEAAFWSCVSGVLAIGWIAVALGTAGRFSPSRVGAGCFATALAVGVALARGGARVASLRAMDRRDLAACVLLLASGLAWARPHEYVLGGADAGTYLNVAANLARTGSLV